MPSYLLLIVEPRGQREARTPEQGRAAYEEMVRFGEGLAAQGKLRGVSSLLPDRLGVRVRRREGKTELRDGTFAEAKEMIGGFFYIDCTDRDEALAIAAACPAAQWATVEVREAAPCYEG